MADRFYELPEERMGNVRVKTTMKSVDEGPTVNYKHDESVNQKIAQAITGAALINPYAVRPLHKNVWAKITPMITPTSEGQLIQVPDSAKQMMRHRAVTNDSTVILFEQGAGKIVRIGGVAEEEEWICLPEKKVLGIIVGGAFVLPMNNYLFMKPKEGLLREVTPGSQIITINPAHVRARYYATGEIVALHEPLKRSLQLEEGMNIMYTTGESFTEVVMRDTILHAVHRDYVYGVLEDTP